MNTHTTFKSHQGGVALIVSLILLVIMTLLGLAAIRHVTLEERMATNSYDRSLAFQATESALRAAELLIDAASPVPGANCGDVSNIRLCPTPVAGTTPRWRLSKADATTMGLWKNATEIKTSDGLAVTPQYFVEFMGADFPCHPVDAHDVLDPLAPPDPMNCKRYRITARSNDGASDRATVMLQSVYATQ